MNISRRDFIKNAAISTAGLAAIGLVGCSTTKPTGENSEPGVESTVITPDEVLECDVAVIGVGVAGISACVEAASLGAKVIGIDRAIGVVGTNAVTTVGVYGVANPGEIGEHFKQMTEATFYQFNNRFTSHYLNIIENQVKRYKENGMTIMSSTHYPTKDEPGLYGEDSILCTTLHVFAKRDGERAAEYEAMLAKYNNIKTMWQTEAIQLISKDGKVTGCYTKDSTGKIYQINAKGGVIVCTGGFIHNKEMVAQYMGGTKIYSYSSKSCDGAGIKLSQSAGAQIGKNFALNMSEGGGVHHKSKEFNTFLFGMNSMFRSVILGSVIINKRGERFVDEALLCKRTMMFVGEPVTREGGALYTIVSQADMEKLKTTTLYEYTLNKFGYKITHDMILMFFAQNPLPNIQKDADAAIAEGWCWKADTFEELSKISGIPNLGGTMKEYNEMCKAGKDTLLFKDPAFLRPYQEEDGPFYLVENDLSAWSTQGGIKTDGNCRAVNSENDIIPGLYVAGMDADLQSVPYILGGSAQGFSVGSGYIAAEDAVKRAKA